MSFYSWQTQSLILKVYIQPRASRNEVIGEYQGELKIKITAPPVDGAANQHLIKLLSEWFSVRKDQIKIIRGETGRHKQVLIENPEKLIAGIKQ